MTLKFVRRYRSPIINMWKRWWREAHIRNSACETLTPEKRELKQEQWPRIAEVNVVLKEDKEKAINGEQKDSVREETSVVSGTMKISVQKPTPTLHPPSHQHKEVEVRRGKRTSEVRVHPGSSLDSHAKITWTCICSKSLCDCWHPPECQFQKSESGFKFGDKRFAAHRQVEGQPSKKPKKDGDKSAVLVLKDARQLGCVFQETDPPESLPILRKSTKVLRSIRRVQFTKATNRHANIRGNKGPSFGKIQVKVLHQRSPYALKFEDRSQEVKDRSDVPAETRGNWPRIS